MVQGEKSRHDKELDLQFCRRYENVAVANFSYHGSQRFQTLKRFQSQ
jgi:hypothetical protein